MIVGNDVSKWQGDINFNTYKDNSNFVIAKCSEGAGVIDPKFAKNKAEALRVGLPFGTYHFARPDLKNAAETEAKYYVQAVGTLTPGELLCLDYEATWSGDVVGWCLAFLKQVETDTGVKPFVYLNQALAKKYNWKPVVDNGNALWIAAYTGDPNQNNFITGAWPSAAMQQWTDAQTVPGISGKVDGDVFFGDVNALKKYGYQPVVIPPPENCTKWADLCGDLGLDPDAATPEQVNNVIGGYKSAKTIAESKLAEFQGQVINLGEQISRTQAQLLTSQDNEQRLTDQLKSKQGELDDMARSKGQVIIDLQRVSNELATLKQQNLDNKVTITWGELFQLLLKQKITIGKG